METKEVAGAENLFETGDRAAGASELCLETERSGFRRVAERGCGEAIVWHTNREGLAP
ncbi:MAG: hypothetical protein IT169_00650 [Bryobacterales bacterium]|nr:hypothetical protein [Bryobacterales bacterium]